MSKPKQQTLFQTWGSSALSQPISQKKKNLPKKPKKTQPSKQPLKSHLITSAAEFVDLCSSSEDEDLILAKEESLKCSTQRKVDAPEMNDDCRANFGLEWDDDDDLDLLLIDNEHSSEAAGAKSNALKHSSDSDRLNEDGCYNKAEQWNLANVVSKPVQPFSCNATTSLVRGNDDAEEIAGFDRDAGGIWIYPTNYPVRDYQYNIILQALFQNTLVTLPTGLGKTFVAAVVMYNFFRWYPAGKVIFMAPTKPLVAQQIEACHNIMGIPMADTLEMTGSMQPTERQREWSLRRVFFLTPQVLVNDLISAICPAADIKCVIVDEAHKALGNHAYCQVVRELMKHDVRYRMVALSATPGSNIKSVQQVLNNLLISHIEMRTEDSIDIQRYRHERKIEKVVVPLGDELNNIKEKYLKIIEVMVQRLRNNHVMYNRDVKSLSKFLILRARDNFRQNPPPQLPRHLFGIVEGDFAICISLYHGYELLLLHGLRSLCNFLEGQVAGEKVVPRTRSELMKNQDFTDLLETLRQTYKPIKNACPNATQLTQKSSQLQSLAVGHPKLAKLEEIVLEHFQKFKDGNLGETRVIIFSQYRASVNEITEILNRHRPLVKAMSFLGQSTGKTTKGFSQKNQLKVMRDFRDGGYNTLVSTCVGEEGLDIGDVDLIVCFDAQNSPIRLVQRMGRTGRKREGRIVMLVSEGKEEKTYNQGLCNKRAVHRAILSNSKSLVFYQNNPRMIPQGVSPVCHRMPMTIPDFVGQQNSRRKTDGNQAKRPGKKSSNGDGFLTDSELRYWSENFKVQQNNFSCNFLSTSEFLCLRKDRAAAICETDNDDASDGNLLSKWLPWQNRLQETHLVEHSLETCHLVELLEFTDIQASCQDDIYGLEMKAFLQMDDIIDPNETRESKMKERGILRFCRTRDSLGDVDDVNSATEGHLEGNKVDESARGRCKKKRRRADANALVETHVEPLIRVIEERDQTDFEKDSDALCDNETEWSESNNIDHKHSEIDSRATLDRGKPEDFPSLSQIVPTKAVESWFSDVGTRCAAAEADGLLMVAPAPSVEEAVASMAQIGRMLRIPSVDVTELFNEWKLEKTSVISDAAVRRERSADLTEFSTSHVDLSSKLQNVSNQTATFAPTTDIDPIVLGAVALGSDFYDGKSNQEMFQQLMPCWDLTLSDDSPDFEEDEVDDNILIEAMQLEITKTIDRSDSEKNRSLVKGRHISIQDNVSASEVNGLNCASKNIRFGSEALTVAPFKADHIPSDLNKSTFEKATAPTYSKCITPVAVVTNQQKTTVGDTAVASMQSHFESRSIAQTSKQNLSLARDGSFIGFEDNADDSILAGINLPSPNHPPPGNANTSQLTFTQALARLQTSYNSSSTGNRTIDKSINQSLNHEPPLFLQPRDDPTPKFAVSEIPVPHFDLGLDLDDIDEDDEDDDVIPPSPPSATPSMSLKLRSLSKVNVGSGEQTTPSNQIQARNLVNSRVFSDNRLGERDFVSQTAARDLSFVSKSCVGTVFHSDEASSAKCHETDALNNCNDSALSAQVEVIDETQLFETSDLTLQRLFCKTPVDSRVKCPSRLRHQRNSTPKQKQPMTTGDESVFTPSSSSQMLKSPPLHLTSTPGLKPARATELKHFDHNNETSGDESFCLVKNKNRNRPAVILSQPSPAVNNKIYSIDDTHTPVRLSRRAGKKRTADRVSSDEESPIRKEAKRPKVTMSSSFNFGGGGDVDDDDDFQDEKVNIRNKLKHPTIGNTRIQNESNKKSRKKRKMLRNKARAFIEEEASVSDVNCSELSSDDEDGSDLDQMDDSFINDDTMLSQSVVNDSIDTHAMYIHSVRSPNIGGLGRYKLKDVRSFRPRADVLSQLHEEDEVEDAYEEDSFCVGESAEDLVADSEYTENSGEEETAETSVKSSACIPKQRIKPKRRRILETSDEEEAGGIDVEKVALSPKAQKNLLSEGTDRLKDRGSESKFAERNFDKPVLPCQTRQNVDKPERRINENPPCGTSTSLTSSSIARSFPSNTTESAGRKELRQITEDRLGDRSNTVAPPGPHSMGKIVGKDIPTFSLDIDALLGDSDDEFGDFTETPLSKNVPPKNWTVLKDRTSSNLYDSISNAGCSRGKPSSSTPSTPSVAAVTSAEKLREERIRLSLQKKEEFQRKFNKR